MPDDATLLRDYAEHRSEPAFAELVRRHTNLVYSAALRRTDGDVHRAQDVVQFVFNELARKPAPAARHPVLAGWLHRATRNAALNAARAERRRQFYEQEAARSMNADPGENPETWTRLRPLLDAVIDGLAPADRDAILLRYFEEHSFADIGRVLSVSEDAARMRVQRALEKLREALQRQGFASTTAALGAVLSTQAVVAAPEFTATITGVALKSAGAATKPGLFGALGAGVNATKTAVLAGGIVLFVAALTIAPGRKNPGPENPPTSTGADVKATAAPAEVADAALSHPATPPANLAPGRSPTVPFPANAGSEIAREPVAMTAAARKRAKITQDYYPLLANLPLTAEGREALITLLVDLRESGADYAAAAAGQGVDVTTDPAGFSRSVKAGRTQLLGEVHALLGPEGFRRYLEFEEELSVRSYAIVLERKLRGTPSPLTTGQAAELTRIIQQRTFDPKGEQLLAAASRFLSAGQLQALREVQDIKADGSKNPKVLDAVRERTGPPAAAPPAP